MQNRIDNTLLILPHKKKLLILVDWFWPGYKAGGPIRSCVNICAALHDHYEIYVLTTDTDHGENDPYPGIVSNHWVYNETLKVHVYYARKKALSLKQIAAQIQACNADLIYLNHLFSPRFVLYPLWLAFTRSVPAKFVLCPRGALYSSALSVKSYKKQPLLYLYKWLSLHKMVTFHATNNREEAAIKKYFHSSKVVVADNLPSVVDVPFKMIEKKEGELKCIFIARIVPIKNLLFLLKALTTVKFRVLLTVVGPVEDEAYWKDCLKAVNSLPGNITVDHIGAKSNDELAGLVQEHHVFALPTTGENFGHSIFEAMQAGRPVLISDQTPWLGLEAKHAGWDLPLNAPEKFTETINTLAAADQPAFEKYARGAWQYAQDFLKNNIAIAQYRKLFS